MIANAPHKAILVVAVLAAAGMMTACTTQALDEVTPVEHHLDFSGDRLDVRQQGIPTDLAVGSRAGVSVSYRVSAAAGDPVDPELSLADGELVLDDPCPPIVFCDVRYRVEVPEGVAVLRDGEPTDITGS